MSSPHEFVYVQLDPEKTETDDLSTINATVTPQPEPHFSDTSIPLFALYLRSAETLDWRRFELLKGDAEQILVFCGLFSAAIAALIVPLSSSPDINFLFTNVKDLIELNRSFNSSEPQLSDDDASSLEEFERIKQTTVFFIIQFWFWSFLTSILCATVALSLQRWARPNSMITSPSYSLPEQARLHALFAIGFKRFNFRFLVEVLHGLVHISLGLFLAGLWKFFDGLTVPMIWLIWFIIFALVYISLTVLPVFQPGFPCSTPFTPIFAIIYGCVVRGSSRLLYLATSLTRISKGTGRATRGTVRHPKNYYRGWNLRKLAEDKAQGLAPRFDGIILKRTLRMLRSDDDLEQFFDAIPGFCASKIVHDPRQNLDVLGQQRLAEALIGFWNRTLSSNMISESIKGRRLLICMGAIEAANLAIAAPGTLRGLSFRYLGGIARSVEVGHSLGNLRHGNVAPLARGIIAGIISNAERNGRWYMLAMDELDISEDVLRDYLSRGESVLLANLIHITRHFFHGLLQPHPDLTGEALSILPSVAKFDILNTLPELQHDFCALWNDVVRQVRGSGPGGAENNPFVEILLDIWGLYVALHGTTACNYNLLRPPTSYPLCEDDSHRNLTSHLP